MTGLTDPGVTAVQKLLREFELRTGKPNARVLPRGLSIWMASAGNHELLETESSRRVLLSREMDCVIPDTPGFGVSF